MAARRRKVLWSVERGGIGGPDAVWLRVGNQGFRVKCEPDPDYPGRPDWYAEQLTKAMRSLEQSAHRAGKVAGMREAVRILSGPHDANSGMDSYTCGTMIAEIDALAAKEEA